MDNEAELVPAHFGNTELQNDAGALAKYISQEVGAERVHAKDEVESVHLMDEVVWQQDCHLQ